MMADDADSWNNLHAYIAVKRINHQLASDSMEVSAAELLGNTFDLPFRRLRG